jgi:hypothetical protein
VSEQELIIEAEAIGVEIEPTGLARKALDDQDVAPAASGTLFRTEDPLEIIGKATRIAEALSKVLRDQKLTSNISGREHVRVEGWTLLGTMLGVYPVVEWTRPLGDGGWEARVEARTLSGAVVGAAEASCSRSEKEWGPTPTRGKMRDDYALRSMAQTRAVSKALRGPLGFVVTLAGYEATPAEEMPSDQGQTGQPEHREGPKPLSAPKSWAKLTEMVAAYDQGTHDLFFLFADAARRLLYPQAVDTKSLPKADRDFMFQKCARAALLLREAFEPSEFPPPGVEEIRGVFAVVLDGQDLAIPDETLDAEAVEAAERDA